MKSNDIMIIQLYIRTQTRAAQHCYHITIRIKPSSDLVAANKSLYSIFVATKYSIFCTHTYETANLIPCKWFKTPFTAHVSYIISLWIYITSFAYYTQHTTTHRRKKNRKLTLTHIARTHIQPNIQHKSFTSISIRIGIRCP